MSAFPLRTAAATLIAAALAGCAIEQQLIFDRPAPAAEAAPTSPVVTRDLPPPGAVANVPAAPAEAGLPPIAGSPGMIVAEDALPPGPPGTLPAGSALPPILDSNAVAANVPPTGVEAAPPPRIAPGAQPAGIGGHWTLLAGGQSCAMNLQEPPSSRTGWSQPGPDCGPFTETASWTLTGSHLFLYDRNTRPLARLAAVGANRFEGTDVAGAPISLSR